MALGQIQRVTGVVGGYILIRSKLTLTHLRLLAADEQYLGHETHNTSIVIHHQGDMGVADALNLNGSVGWKCSDCVTKVPYEPVIINEANVNPHFQRPAEFGLVIK